MKSITPTLQHRQLWVMPNPNTDIATKPIGDRLLDLHNGLRASHAGLWINPRPKVGESRYRLKDVEADGLKFTAYLVCFNQHVTKDQVLAVARGFGFTLVKDPEPTPNIRVSTMTVAAVSA
jgi:hypothetical protein